MDGRAEPPPVSAAEQPEGDTEDNALFAKVQRLIAKTVSSPENPNPKVLHAIASILEAQEAIYLQESGNSSLNNGRSSHIIGKLGNLIRENDDFFELISSKFLSDNRYPVCICAAAARLLFSCSPTWMYPHVFDDEALENIKQWVMSDALSMSSGKINGQLEMGLNKLKNVEMLKTYATGLLSLALTGGGQVVEDVLTSDLPSKLMRYLRGRVLSETTANQRDLGHTSEIKYTTGPAFSRIREENRVRYRQNVELTHAETARVGDEFLRDDQGALANCTNRSINFSYGNADSVEGSGVYEVTRDDEEGAWDGLWQHGKDICGSRSMFRLNHDEDDEESAKDDLWRLRGLRGWGRMRGKGRNTDDPVANDRDLTLLSSGSRVAMTGRLYDREKNAAKYSDSGHVRDVEKSSRNANEVDRVENDDRLKACHVGTRDISDIIRKATKAAEAEAGAANAPMEAIIAAGDAAAELVKTAALEAMRSSNDEEAAVLAASKAASTVIDAAAVAEVLQNPTENVENSVARTVVEPEITVDVEELSIPDEVSLGQLREKYCIHCLEILGEYVEVLGPVLHEKGVDVCLALLQCYSTHKEGSENSKILPAVLKLICSLAAHRKFAAVFVDRGGMQKLLSVPRLSQTYLGLSSCLFTICTLQGIMERVCALPSDIVHQVIELALQLLECPQDQARKNAAVFFASAFVFRAVLDGFDAQEGLQKMLNLLHGAASVRLGSSAGSVGNQSNGSLRNDRSSAEVLTASEKQIAYQTCVALRQYFRAHLLLLVDSLRPNKSQRSVGRNIPTARAAYKPLDISNEAMDAIFLHIQRDRKLGSAFVRVRWSAVDKFLASNGHITMLELCQAPTVERYLHDLAQYALGVLHIVTVVPYSRKVVVNATLSNDRVGMAVILDAANGVGYVDPEVIHPALNVLVNLVCPPPSISNKSTTLAQCQPCGTVQMLNNFSLENRANIPDRLNFMPNLSDPNSNSHIAGPGISSGVVGDRRISLGPGAGCAGLAAQLEQGYRQAREAVRANNGIKVLLHLLHPRIFTPPAALDCLRALACRVLLGLARDETIAHILTKLQVGKKLSELIRDSGSQISGTEQGRWQAELTQVAIELIAIVTNSGRATTLAATDATAPTLRRIERAAIAAATPITYHSRELLLLIHEHLQASGLTTTADALFKEAQLTPLTSSSAPPPLLHQTSVQETTSVQIQWPSGRVAGGFLSDAPKMIAHHMTVKSETNPYCSEKKPLVLSSSLCSSGKIQLPSHPSSVSRTFMPLKTPFALRNGPEDLVSAASGPSTDADHFSRSPVVLPMKRKVVETKDSGVATPAKRIIVETGFHTPVCHAESYSCKGDQSVDLVGYSVGTVSNSYERSAPPPSNCFVDNSDDVQENATPAATLKQTMQPTLASESQACGIERVSLDSLVVQYLKHQHRQCPAPITTLPPLSLLHPHVCPESSQNLAAPTNITARLATREFRYLYGGTSGLRKDRQFVYSRFRPWRTCRDDAALFTCITFLEDSSRIATGCHSGEIKIFDSNSGNVLESHTCHQSPVILVRSALSNAIQLILSSGTHDVRLWDAASISSGPIHSFEGCKAARFGHSGTVFATLSVDSSLREVLLYDVATGSLDFKFSDSSCQPPGPGRGHVSSLVHFNPLDTMLLCNGVLWDRRDRGPVHRFDQFTDYGGGGFHPAGNEVIINSEVWDLRRFKLLRSVPSLDQTVVTFNPSGDVIYAILRRNLEDITSAVHTRRVRHPLFPAFRTLDAVNYSDIATTMVDRCVLDFAADPTDSFVGVVAMDDHEEMFSSARLHEIGRRRAAEDDSDPDDGAETEEEDEEEEAADLNLDSGGNESEQDDSSNEEEDDDESVGDFDADDEDPYNELMPLDAGRILERVIGGGGEDGDEYSQADSLYDSDEDPE